MFRGRLMSILLGAAAAGTAASCGREAGELPQVGPMPLPAAIPGVFAGTFPCANCPGIDVVLWLRGDGLFLIRQVYLAPEQENGPEQGNEPPRENEQGNEPTNAPLRENEQESEPLRERENETRAYGVGSWAWDTSAAALLLSGRGPRRVFESAAPNVLALQTAAQAPHVLTLDSSGPPFEDTIRLEGLYGIDVSRGPTFTECTSGVVLALAESGEYAELRRQNRTLNRRGEPILAELGVRFAGYGTETEALVVEEVVTLKPGRQCAAGRAAP